MDLSIIHQRIAQIDGYEQENKIAKETLKSELENDPVYLAACDTVKEAVKERKRVKDEILNRDENLKLRANIKENTVEIATMREILAVELVEFFTENKTDEIEDQDGEARKFKISVRLQPKKNKNENRDHEGKYIEQLTTNN